MRNATECVPYRKHSTDPAERHSTHEARVTGSLQSYPSSHVLNPEPRTLNPRVNQTSPSFKPGARPAYSAEDADGNTKLECALPLGAVPVAARADAAEPD
jgi:hypothetical protein